MKRYASAVWQGTLKEGKGALTTQSGTLKGTPYTFRSRFGEDPETNPEELIAAAHAGCFTMALSMVLGEAGFTADSLSTKATLTMEQMAGGFVITAVHLDLTGKVPGIGKAKFEEAANGAKANCPVSKVLNATITLTVTLA
jgi:osmotically inducible protein OsmC